MRPYSPPRRPSMAPLQAEEPKRDPPPSSHDVEKDEFGRDIRPGSPENTITASNDLPTQPQLPPPATVVDTETVELPPALSSNDDDEMSLSPPVAANTSSRSPDAATVSNEVAAQGMESFNLTTFDFTSPSSWEALGKLWQVTHGYLPSTEQLMQFVMSGGSAVVMNQQQPQQENWGAWGSTHNVVHNHWSGGRGRGRGRGGHGQNQNWQSYGETGEETDAIVLGGGSGDSDDGTAQTDDQIGKAGGLGGRMQRVGDKWVFMRDPVASSVS